MIVLKRNNANGMPLFSKNLKIQYLRNKLILYKFPASWKRQAKLFQNCANLNTRQKPFSNQILSRQSFHCARIERKLLVMVKKDKRMFLLSRKLKIQYPRKMLICYKSPVLCKTEPSLFQSCANWTNK